VPHEVASGGRRCLTLPNLEAVYTTVYIAGMGGVEWDSEKRERNIEERGVDFADAALIFEDTVLEERERERERARTMGKPGTGLWDV
jgi:hypothetical protein